MTSSEGKENGRSRRRFDTAFKATAVKRVVDGEALKVVALDLGVNPTLLSRWKKEIQGPARARGEAAGSGTSTAAASDPGIKQALRQELNRLERESRQLEKKIAQIKATLALY